MSIKARKRLLLIAFHFPPIQGSTGVHRTLAFARYLERYGWDVTVLTAAPCAYPDSEPENHSLIPAGLPVVRTLALDAQRHLSVFGRYPGALARPDRWRSWIYTGFPAGRRLVKQWRPQAILSTFPIASAHEIAWRLSRACNLPWVADFRDPMGQDVYPADERLRQAYWSLESRVMAQCSAVTVTTEGTATLYRARYPGFSPSRVRVIPNGFDEWSFRRMASEGRSVQREPGPLRFLHSGILYPVDRNPEHFFRAIAELRSEGRLSPETVHFGLRGAGHAERYEPVLASLGLTDLVSVLPMLSYEEAHREMIDADVLMLFQAATCNSQIPAKLYEYLYVGRPLVAFTDPEGDTGRLLGELGMNTIAPIDDVAAIKALVVRAIADTQRGTAFLPPRESVMRFSRAGTTQQLAELLDEVAQR